MKRIKYNFLLILAVSVLFTACKEDYLETSPTDAISSGTVFQTTNNGWAAINGIHRALYIQWLGNQDQGGHSANMMYSDMMGEDVVMTAQGNGWLNADYQWLAHRNVNSRTPYFSYYFYYRIIANANNIINNIDNAEGPDADKKAIKGQALAYRSWCYFNLVQLFGKRYVAGQNNTQLGVPILLVNTTEGQPRATVEEVYTQAIADIDAAITNLQGYTRGHKSNINANVAKGIKARIALTKGDWATAATMAAEARQGYALMSNAQYLQGFNDLNNPEWIWGVEQISDQQTYFYSFFAYMSANFNSTNIRTNPKAISSTLYEQISATDVRKQLWDPTGSNTAFPTPPGGIRKPFMNRKFMSESSSLSIGDLPLMRAGEMYLIEAEARAHMGEDGAAQDALFTLLKNRDASYTKTTATSQALVNEILLQRRIELWGEGFRFQDLKRTNSPLDRTGANHNSSLALEMTIPADDIRWEFLIPQREINANPAIVQNP